MRRLGHRTRRQPPPQARGIRQLDRHAGVEEPPHRRAEEALLVDRLVGPHVLQLGRAVGGQHDHRRARVESLHDRRVELGGGGAGRRQDDRRLSGRFAQADGEERPGSLVDMDEDFDARMTLQRHGDRRRARSRRDAGKLDALRGQLIHEGRGEGLRDISHRIES